jgi:hypothetical protein
MCSNIIDRQTSREQRMIAGHIGAAAGAKRWAPHVPLWAMLVASFLLDILFGILWLFGVEGMSNLEGTDGGYGELALQVDWSHSFFGTLFLCLVVLIVGARKWGGRGGFVLSCVVFSHWFLDLIVHRLDMPIMPGNAAGLPRVGLAMWDFPVFVLILEIAIVAGGVWIWYSSPDVNQKAKRAAIITGVIGLLVLAADFTL